MSDQEWARLTEMYYLTYLTNYHIIWATIIVQLLVPFLHHAGLAVIISLMAEK